MAHHVTLRMDDQLYARLKSYGDENEQTVSQAIRYVLRYMFTDKKLREKKK